MRYSIEKILTVVFVLVTIYFVGLVNTKHQLRASIIKVIEVRPETLSLAPSEIDGLIRFEDRELLTQFKSFLPEKLQHDGLDNSSHIMLWLGDFYQHRMVVQKVWLPESPDRMVNMLLKEGKRGSCYNDAVMLGTLVQLTGVNARYVAFNSSDGFGGKGHFVTEIWEPRLNKWVLYDQQQVAHFYDRSTRIPLSAMEVRERVLSLTRKEFLRDTEIKQGGGYLFHKDRIWEIYQSSNDLVVLGSADYSSRNQKYLFNKIADWIESNMEPYSQILLVGRLIRGGLGEKPRLRVIDRFTPAIHYGLWYYIFRAAVFIWVSSLLGLVVFKIRKRYQERVKCRTTLKNPVNLV